MDDIVQKIAVYALPVIFAITLHEAAHAYAAKYFGDATAYLQGRMSLNPMKHIDPIGTVLLPLVLLFSGGFLFGYAKPVPLEFGNLRNPKRDTAWVALAGPAANFVMAVLWQIVGLLLTASQVGEAYFLRVAEAGVLTNLLLFAFNLFPLPPLDGGRIMTSLLPAKQAYQLARLEPYGFFIVLALAFFQVLNLWMVPVMTMTNVVIKLIVFPLNLLLN